MNPAALANWKKWTIGVLSLIVLIVVGFFATATFARLNMANKYPPDGKIITLADGRGLHVTCEGQGNTTVLLEAGLNEFSIHWNRLLPLLARESRVCAYDRAGFGWSDLSPLAPTVENRVSDFEAVVKLIADQQPLVVVGHSYGSFIVRLYAQRNPQFIKAIVLLDPASEWMAERIDGYANAINMAKDQFNNLVPIARLGLMALMAHEIPAGFLSGVALDRYRASLAAGHFFEAASAETSEMINNIKKMQSIPQDRLAAIPVVVISRGLPDPIPGLSQAGAQNLEKTWAELQRDLVIRLHAKQVTAANSGHSISLQQPELVHETIRPFLDNRSSTAKKN